MQEYSHLFPTPTFHTQRNTDNLNILDIDECSQDSNKCGSNGDCINTPGSYDCECRNGYKNEGENCTGTKRITFRTLSM